MLWSVMYELVCFILCYFKSYFKLHFIDFYRDCGCLSDFFHRYFTWALNSKSQFCYSSFVFTSPYKHAFPMRNRVPISIIPFIYQAGICYGSNICSPRPYFSTLSKKAHTLYRTSNCMSIKKTKQTTKIPHMLSFAELLLQQLMLGNYINKHLIFLLQNFFLCHCKYVQSLSHQNDSFPFLTRLPYVQLNT